MQGGYKFVRQSGQHRKEKTTPTTGAGDGCTIWHSARGESISAGADHCSKSRKSTRERNRRPVFRRKLIKKLKNKLKRPTVSEPRIHIQRIDFESHEWLNYPGTFHPKSLQLSSLLHTIKRSLCFSSQTAPLETSQIKTRPRGADPIANETEWFVWRISS